MPAACAQETASSPFCVQQHFVQADGHTVRSRELRALCLVFHAATGNRAALPAPLTRLHNEFR